MEHINRTMADVKQKRCAPFTITWSPWLIFFTATVFITFSMSRLWLYNQAATPVEINYPHVEMHRQCLITKWKIFDITCAGRDSIRGDAATVPHLSSSWFRWLSANTIEIYLNKRNVSIFFQGFFLDKMSRGSMLGWWGWLIVFPHFWAIFNVCRQT